MAGARPFQPSRRMARLDPLRTLDVSRAGHFDAAEVAGKRSEGTLENSLLSSKLQRFTC